MSEPINLEESEPELFKLSMSELRKNEELLIHNVNVKLKNIQVYDHQDVRNMLEASRSLIDHANNLYAQLNSALEQVKAIVQRLDNQIEEAKRNFIPWHYKVGAAIGYGLALVMSFI